jgi:hypothetical protein
MFAIFFGLRAYHCLFMKDIYFCGFVGLYGMRTNIIKKGVKERLEVEGGGRDVAIDIFSLPFPHNFCRCVISSSFFLQGLRVEGIK